MPKRTSSSQLLLGIVCTVAVGLWYVFSDKAGAPDADGSPVSPEAQASADAPQPSADASQPSPAAEGAADEAPVEMPAVTSNDVVINHTGYVLSYNTTTNCPNWVAWELTRDEAKAYRDRYDDFQPDPDVAAPSQVTTRDYSGSGYTRGHMCPAADMRWSDEAQRECFYMSNMCPQLEYLNTESWEELEKACRQWAKREGSVYIVCGPVFDPKAKARTIGREHKVRVPDGFFKAVLSLRPGHEKAIGFYYAHNEREQTIEATAMSVDDLERVTGYDFFDHIDPQLEGRIEAHYNLNDWK